ncbi:hypothetical protein F8388_015909 [Cannabis sativa]|uniref:Ribosomal protein S4 n=1 Tax=Cannabis sativa TaxID=3483 RepID=A0A7J6EQ86_CANSA|nr:hypothetical protein F8388_015909 [Cannabis sativa]
MDKLRPCAPKSLKHVLAQELIKGSQTFFKSSMAKSIHDARVLIRKKKHYVLNIPSFMVRIDSQKLIDFSITSPFRGGCPIQVKRKNQKAVAKKASGGDGDEEDEE